MGGASLTYLPDRSTNPFYLKFLTSTFQINENERFDIIGDYLLGQVESDLGSDNFGEIVGVLGTGTQQQFVRNYLTSNVTNLEHKGGLELQGGGDENSEKSHFLQWGVKFQHEQIDDEINEWERLDSAGYSLNYDTSEVLIRTVLKTRNSLSSNRISAYFQDTWSFRNGYKEIKLSAGVRAQYWDLNGEFIVSPRAQLLYKPVATDKDISYRLAAGLYFQPPFYRELRQRNGLVNTDVQAQKSLHVVGGISYDFFNGENEFKEIQAHHGSLLQAALGYGEL